MQPHQFSIYPSIIPVVKDPCNPTRDFPPCDCLWSCVVQARLNFLFSLNYGLWCLGDARGSQCPKICVECKSSYSHETDHPCSKDALLTFSKRSACKTRESLELHLLPDNPLNLLKKAGNAFNVSNNYQPFQHLWCACNLQLEEHQKGGLGGISVIEGDYCFDLPSLTKKKETEYRKPYWKGRQAWGLMEAHHSQRSKGLRKDGRWGIRKAEIKHISFSVSFSHM